MVQTSAHPKDFVVRSDTEPPSPFPGQIWQDTSGNNVETNQRSTGSWELVWAIGPDNPDHPVEGSIWRNTTTDANQVYDGTAWQSIGVSDHGQLTGITESDHHPVRRGTYEWDSFTTHSTGRDSHGAFSIGGTLYIAGGEAGASRTNTTEAYDPVTDSWTGKANLPDDPANVGAASLNGLGYIIGGYDGANSADVYQYDPGADSWSAVASIPAARRYIRAFADGSNVYACGGGAPNADVYQYDPGADSWSAVASLPAARSQGMAFFDGTYGYYAGGSDGTGPVTDVYRYDPGADSWSAVASLPAARRTGAAYFDGTYGYVVGGRDSGGSAVATVYRYDPSADSWDTPTGLPETLNQPRAAYVTDFAFVTGGENKLSRNYSAGYRVLA